MRLVIGGPTREIVSDTFAVKLAELYANVHQWVDFVWPLRFMRSTYIHVGREEVLSEALRLGATHVLWLDTDMEFPANLALRLAQHDQPVVACNYRMRNASDLFTAFRDEQRIPTRADATGLEAVDYCGMGAMLMRTDVVANLQRPWFRHGTNAHGGDIGEDVMFCRALRAAGHTVYIDHDLSKEIGHIGQTTYRTLKIDTVVV